MSKIFWCLLCNLYRTRKRLKKKQYIALKLSESFDFLLYKHSFIRLTSMAETRALIGGGMNIHIFALPPTYFFEINLNNN